MKREFDERDFSVKNITVAQVNDPELLLKFSSMYQSFKTVRAQVIDWAIDTEDSLKVAICFFFFESDFKKHDVFRGMILDAEFCSFMQKRRILSHIFDNYSDTFPSFNREESKELLHELNNIILDRNKFAHGRVFVNAGNNTIELHYYHGKQIEEEIKPDAIEEMKERVKKVDRLLGKLIDYTRDNPII